MRVLTTATQVETERQAGAPFHLIYLGLPSGNLYVSTGPAVSWNARSYVASATAIREYPSSNRNGLERATVQLDNADRSASALVLSGDVRTSVARIWRCYTDTPAAGDPVLLMDGYVAHVPEIADLTVTLELSSRGARYLRAPRVRVGEDLVGNLVPPGTEINWGNERIVIEEPR